MSIINSCVVAHQFAIGIRNNHSREGEGRKQSMSVRTYVITYVCVRSRAMSVRTYVSGAEHECTYVCNNVRMCQEQSMSVRTYVSGAEQ